jgi:ribosomal protein S18 acetylase RimI-like enzyme
VIRPATHDDAQAVVDVAVDSGLFPADDAGIVTTMMADYFANKSDEGHLCIIDEDDEPLAVAYYQAAPAADRTWYLTMIAVRLSSQGQGRGAALLRHVENDLRARGQRLLLVETSGLPTFRRTRAFYEGCGYEEEARVRDYYETGDDMILLRKALE